MTRGARDERGKEAGAVLLTVLIGTITLVAVAALVLDLAAIRVNRAVSQTLADSAATAGAIDSAGLDGQTGCETAFDYLELNLPTAGTFSGGDCLLFTNSCDAVTPAVSTTATAGEWVATITYPVLDDSPLLISSAIGNPTQALHADDGNPCDRFGVSIDSTHNYLFGRMLGATTQSSEIHAVARGFEPEGSDFALNLLILERYDCDALSAGGGGGGTGGIIVDAVFNPDTGELDNGYIAIDSDASGTCGAKGVVSTNGSSALIRSDGAAGCAGQIGTHVGPGSLLVGEGCGQIQLIAPGVPGCNYPACTNGGVIAPDPSRRRDRITRAPVDHLYNCKANYPFPIGWEIDPCTETPAPYIDNLVAALGGTGAVGGYDSWTGAGYPCNPNFDIVVPAGNWHVDCSDFRPRETVLFQAGNVIFDGGITLNSDAVLAFNSDPLIAFPFGPDGDESIVYVRDGLVSKGAQASLIAHETMIYLSDTSEITMAGGSGLVFWSAPTDGLFENLALWSESADDVKFSGGSGLSLEGVFFSPWGAITYTGSGSQVQVSAQFIARRLEVGGNGRLVVRPSFTRAVLFPFDPQSQLIR